MTGLRPTRVRGEPRSAIAQTEGPNYAMTFRRRLTVALLAFASIDASADPALAQAQPDSTASSDREAAVNARKLVDRAMVLYSKSDWEGARELLLQAWKTRPHRAILATLADVEIKGGRYLEAARHLQELIAQLPAEPAERVDSARAQLELCRGELASLQIEVNTSGATVSVNDEIVGMAPIASEVFALPGTVRVAAEDPERGRAATNLLIGKGQKETVTLALEENVKPVVAKPKPVLAVTPPPAVPERPSYRTRNIVVISGAVVAVAGAAVGTVLWVKSKSTWDDVVAQRQLLDFATGEFVENSCRPSRMKDPAGCAKLVDLARQYDREHNVALGAFVGAGAVAVATTLTFLLWPSKRPRKSGLGTGVAMAVEPWSDRDINGLRLTGSF